LAAIIITGSVARFTHKGEKPLEIVALDRTEPTPVAPAHLGMDSTAQLVNGFSKACVKITSQFRRQGLHLARPAIATSMNSRR
jgi:hypothetical protein